MIKFYSFLISFFILSFGSLIAQEIKIIKLHNKSIDQLVDETNINFGTEDINLESMEIEEINEVTNTENENNIDKLIPGITGLAQINGRDSLTIPEKVEYEIEYIKKKSLFFDIYLIFLTIIRVNKKNISH